MSCKKCEFNPFIILDSKHILRTKENKCSTFHFCISKNCDQVTINIPEQDLNVKEVITGDQGINLLLTADLCNLQNPLCNDCGVDVAPLNGNIHFVAKEKQIFTTYWVGFDACGNQLFKEVNSNTESAIKNVDVILPNPRTDCNSLIQLNGLYSIFGDFYQDYIRDGNTSTFNSVPNNPYQPTISAPKEIECYPTVYKITVAIITTSKILNSSATWLNDC